MFYVYVLFSESLNRYYVGHTSQLQKRLDEHNTGLSQFTSRARDWKLLYNEEFETRQQAQERERQIKKKKSRSYIDWLVNKKS